MTDKEKVETAEHDGKTYVVSHSLQKRLKRTENLLAIHTVFLALTLSAILIVMFIKWDTVLKIIQGLI